MKLFPVPIISVLAGVLVASTFLYPKEMFRDGGVGMLLMFLVAIGLFAWHGVRLKSVSIDLDGLYVSGYLKSTVIPLDNIKFVHYSPGVGLVVVQLKSASTFGNTITFMPTLANGLLALFAQPSIVEELRSMAQNAAARSANAI